MKMDRFMLMEIELSGGSRVPCVDWCSQRRDVISLYSTRQKKDATTEASFQLLKNSN